jgi:hypothetical protein
VRPLGASLETLLDRAAENESGTYALTGGDVAAVQLSLPVVVQADVLRGAEGTIRVPVVVAADVPRASEVRLRIVAPGGPGRPAQVVANGEGSGGVGLLRLIHDFTLAAGEYEMHAVVGYRENTRVIASLRKSRLVVPDVLSGEFAVTPVVLADEVGPARSTSAPFVFGPTGVLPAASGRFPQAGAVNFAFRVYNWESEGGTDPGRARPDLTIEYVFYQKTEKRLAFFNKVKPQQLGSDPLPDNFDPGSRMVTAGMTVPLVSFPHGEFQLRVRVTDNRSKRSAEQQVNFAVAP